MTWRSLLSTARPFFSEQPEEPPSVPPPAPAPSPPLETINTTSAAPASPVSSIGTAHLNHQPTTSTSSVKSNDSNGVFQLPPSPSQASKQTIDNTSPPTPTPPKNNPDSAEARWEPPSTGFLLHQNPKAAQTMLHKQTPPSISTWFIENEDTNEQPYATSPVKEAYRHHPLFFAAQQQQQQQQQASKPTPIDQQKARLLFSQDFQQGIARLEEERKKLLAETSHNNNNSEMDPFDDGIDFDDSMTSLNHSNNNNNNNNNNIQVFVRKRPLATDPNNFSVVQVETDQESTHPSVVVYHTEIQQDLRKKQVRPILYGPFASCFDEHVDSGQVYKRAVKSLVESAKGGGLATLLVFGQVDSGKSYTMSAVEGMAARDIFTKLPYNHIVRVSCLEICGSACTDLLDDSSATCSVRIVNTEQGVRFVNALSIRFQTPENLLAAIVAARKRRKSNASHLICRITVLPPKDAPSCIRPGHLTLVDCCGTGGGNDNNPQTSASLRVLKECLKSKTCGNNDNDNKEPPYSQSTLTRCLRESMEREDATFHIIATVSPKATDTEDTMETLQTVSKVTGGYPAEELPTTPSADASLVDEDPLPPKAWDRSRLCEWLARKHLLQDTSLVPTDMNGRKVMQMTKAELQSRFYGNEWEKADRLYRCLRAENDRVARLEVKRRMAMERSRRSK